MKNSLFVRLLLAVASLALMVFTVEAKLTIGDPAPKLQVGQWVQGEPVTGFDTNHIYIVEFWATWCGPCRESIPHLNALWEKFKDKGVIVIGQDVWDSDEAVAPFVEKMGDQMTYRIALDDKSQDAEGFMADNWWKRGIEHHGIPNAFIINQQGLIAWIGHPLGLNEKLVSDIVSGQYDLAKAAAEYEEQEKQEATWEMLNDKLDKAVNEKRWDDAASALDEVLKLAPKLGDSYAWLRLRILLGQKKYDEAYQFADSFSDSHPADADRQNALAWTMITQEGIEHPNLALAQKLAARANQGANGRDAGTLDTLARIQFMNGQTNDAVITEQKAIDVSTDQEKDFLRSSLSDYVQGKLPPIKE
jgi:thiol-disulfide isomerase/thioredoxin